jgi:MoxR-like ATPase
MPNIQDIKLELARRPFDALGAAHNKFFGNFPASKSEAVGTLADAIANGAATINDIDNIANSIKSAPTRPVPTQPDVALGAKVDSTADALRDAVHKLDATASVASKAQDDALIAIGKIDKLDQVVGQAVALMQTMSGRIDGLKIDDRSVQGAVDKIIGNHFAKFAKLVKDEKKEAFVADLTSVSREVKTSFDVFGVQVLDAKGQMMMVDVWNHPDAPAVDPDFIWTENILRHLLLSDATGENLWFGGEKGTGKSETARQFAARTGRAFKRINFHKHTTVEEYVGAVGLVNGQTVFQPKDFLMGYSTPSTVILLDEITNADPAELATLNGFLEPNACVSFGGVTHRRANGVLIFVADNTFGSGDDSGRHAGTRMQNVALVDRFSRVIPFAFLPKKQEIDAIVRRSGCTKTLADHIHKCITLARQKVASAEIVDAPSIRSAIAFARAVNVLPVREAWDTTITARQPSESHAALQGIFEACIDPHLIAENI